MMYEITTLKNAVETLTKRVQEDNDNLETKISTFTAKTMNDKLRQTTAAIEQQMEQIREEVSETLENTEASLVDLIVKKEDEFNKRFDQMQIFIENSQKKHTT